MDPDASSFVRHPWLWNCLQAFGKEAVGLLGNLVNKLPSEEKTMVKAFTEMAKGKLDNLSKDSAWSLYKELSIVITHLKQLEQDAKWD